LANVIFQKYRREWNISFEILQRNITRSNRSSNYHIGSADCYTAGGHINFETQYNTYIPGSAL